MLGMWAHERWPLWDNVRQICDSAAVISAGWGYWGWQTEPDWTAGHFSTGRLTPLMSAHRCPLTVGAFLHPRLSQTTHIWKNVPPGLSFLKNASHLNTPQPIWTPLNLGNPAMIAVCMCFWCVASSLGTVESLCKSIPKSQYHLKKFTCGHLCRWSR